MRKALRIVIWIALVGGAVGCRYQPIWLQGPTPTPSLAPAPTATLVLTPLSEFPTPVPILEGCQPLPGALNGAWGEVRDSSFGYSFKIPVAWRVDTSLGSDLVLAFSDANASQDTSPANLPCGLIQFEMKVDGIGSWVGWKPDPGTQAAIVAGLPAWRLDSAGPEVGAPVGRTTQVYLAAGNYFYFLNFRYFPPPSGSDNAALTDPAVYEAIVQKILESLTVRVGNG